MNEDAIILILPKPINSSVRVIIWNPQRPTESESVVFVYDNSEEVLAGFRVVYVGPTLLEVELLHFVTQPSIDTTVSL